MPCDKLSKIQTLKLASYYIEFMHDILGTSVEKRHSLVLNPPVATNPNPIKLKDPQHQIGSSVKKRKLNNKQTLNNSKCENKHTLATTTINGSTNLNVNPNKINNTVTQNDNFDYFVCQNPANPHLHQNFNSQQQIDSYLYSYEQHENNNDTYLYTQYQYEYY